MQSISTCLQTHHYNLMTMSGYSAGPTLQAMEARQLQSATQVKQLSQEMEHLQEALSTALEQGQNAQAAAQQQPPAWATTHDGALEQSMTAMSFGHAGSHLTSHPVSVTPDVSPARTVPLNMAGYDGVSMTDAQSPDSIGAFDGRTDYSDVVSGSLTVPVLLPGSSDSHR